MKSIKHICVGCGKEKNFREDQKYCSRQCLNRKPVLEESSQIEGNNWEISLPKTRVHTLDQLIEFCKVDLTIWSVRKFTVNKWEMGYVDKLGDAQTEPLYQVKAFLERKINVLEARLEIEDILKLAEGKRPVPFQVKKPTNVRGGMIEINLTDHHFGKLAWGLETNSTNYDVKIATRLFNRAIDTILSRSPYESYEEIWFVVGNDLFNSDDTQGRTTAGTQVESDHRHEKTYVTVRTLLVETIERLRSISQKVKVIVVPGNHDFNATWHLGDSLALYFSKHKDVEVDNRPSSRKYHQYGNTLIGYTHGDKGKQKDLPILMTVEAREIFGRTKFHEWHTGHTHQSKTEEFHGIRVRILPALCSADAWHAENGYVGNLRSSEAFIWDKQEGLVGIVIYTDNDDLIERASESPTIVNGGK